MVRAYLTLVAISFVPFAEQDIPATCVFGERLNSRTFDEVLVWTYLGHPEVHVWSTCIYASVVRQAFRGRVVDVPRLDLTCVRISMNGQSGHGQQQISQHWLDDHVLYLSFRCIVRCSDRLDGIRQRWWPVLVRLLHHRRCNLDDDDQRA
eukprot:COSAG02_NODE_8586_length_2513_cov_1.447390_3_plen_150_part_00